MQHSPYTDTKTSHYAPFSGVFDDAQSASDFRKDALRFIRKPYRPPEGDPSIQEHVLNRQYYIRRIYNAMTCGDMAKDNPGSIAMRRWVNVDFYPSNLVEAYAHKVFDCLIEQVENGFRGWQHNDYASDDRKGDPEDKTVSCAERLDNIIKAIKEEKTICEDIMTSSCQIRMFVNAPRTYARRKEANRHGNSKRRKLTEATISKVTKQRRLNPIAPIRSRHFISNDSFPPTRRYSYSIEDNEIERQNLPQESDSHTVKTPLIHNSISGTNQGLITNMTCINNDIFSESTLSGHYIDSRLHGLTCANKSCFNTVQLPHFPLFQSPLPALTSASTTLHELSPVNNAFSYLKSPADSLSESMFQERDIGLDADLFHITDTDATAGTCEPLLNGARHGLPSFINPGEPNTDPSLEGLENPWASLYKVQQFSGGPLHNAE